VGSRCLLSLLDSCKTLHVQAVLNVVNRKYALYTPAREPKSTLEGGRVRREMRGRRHALLARQRRQFQKVTRFTGYVLSYPARPNFGVTIKAKSGRIRRWHQVLYVTKHTFWQHHNLSLSQHVGEGGGERSLCLVQHA